MNAESTLSKPTFIVTKVATTVYMTHSPATRLLFLLAALSIESFTQVYSSLHCSSRQSHTDTCRSLQHAFGYNTCDPWNGSQVFVE